MKPEKFTSSLPLSTRRLSFRCTSLSKDFCAEQRRTGQTRSPGLVVSSCRHKPRPRRHQSRARLLHQLSGATGGNPAQFPDACATQAGSHANQKVLVGDEGGGSHAPFPMLMKQHYHRQRPEKFPRTIRTCLRSRASRSPRITHCASRNARLSGKGHIYFFSNWTQ